MIRLYENKRKLRGENKILNGHLKGIKCLSYCSYLKYLISCAFDFNVLVWNISLDHPVAKLSGHDAPLICVICPSDLKSYLISGDSKGTIKLWDLTSFGLIQNLVAGEGVGRMKAVIHR
jgi:WD40 repeat protein